MTRRTLSFALVVGMTLGLASSALAAAPKPIPGRQAEMKAAMTRLSLQVDSERVAYTDRGRQDVILKSRTPLPRVLAEVKQAYRTSRALPNGFQVVGWAHIDATDTWTVTLKKDGVSYVAEMSDEGAGSQVRLWGAARRAPGGTAK